MKKFPNLVPSIGSLLSSESAKKKVRLRGTEQESPVLSERSM